MNNGTFSYTRNNGWRSISPVERANAIVWLNGFVPANEEERRAKKILTYFLCDNLSAQAICRKQDPDIVCYSNRKKGKPLSTTSILRVIYSYFPQFEGRNQNSTMGNKRVELMRKREKQESGHIKQCAFCGSKNNLEEHHMIPLFLGGTNDDDNLIFLCKKCHRSVSNYQAKLRIAKNDPSTGG